MAQLLKKPQRRGATLEDWFAFDLGMGLTADLLPVVSNPDAKISPNSRMKALGKTPSLYNSSGHVVGIPKWTERQSKGDDIERWSQQPDYGICLQTRDVRAIDIDLEDKATVDRVLALAEKHLGFKAPLRFRADSNKCLIAFILPGDYTKRILPVGDERIEFLATGQQFVACGTHPKGARYEWWGGLPDSFPTVSPEAFDACWEAMVKEIGTGDPTTMGTRRRGADLGIDDPVTVWLESKWETFGYGNDGQLFIKCPFEDQHTMDSGQTATAYFPAGTGGYEQGHYKCLHAHCADKDDGDFNMETGYTLKHFDDMPDVVPFGEGVPAGAGAEPWPKLARDSQGRIEPTVTNMYKVLHRDDMCKIRIGYDSFSTGIKLAPYDTERWRAFTDNAYVKLQMELEQRGFKRVPMETLRAVVATVAEDNTFDTVMIWLDTLEWDGVKRIDTFFETYFGTDPNDYTRAAGAYLWTALAGRVVQPGVKADMVPVLVGKQGTRKSTAVECLSPNHDFFTEISLQDKDADLTRRMRGRLVIELSELRGLHSREMEAIKAFVTHKEDTYIPKYKEFTVTLPRRVIFIGTTNKQEFLADDTGNRRWLPVVVGDTIDTDAIIADRDQLWAEGRERFKAGGVEWQEAERLGVSVHEQHRFTDTWEQSIDEWLDQPGLDGATPRESEYLKMRDILVGALNFAPERIQHRDTQRAGAAMRVLGFESINKKVEGKVLKVWVRKE